MFVVSQRVPPIILQRSTLFADGPNPYKVWLDFASQLYRQNASIPHRLMESNMDRCRQSEITKKKKKKREEKSKKGRQNCNLKINRNLFS